MTKRNILCGIDVGSSNVRTVIAQIIPNDEKPRIIGVGIAPSSGVRRGVIVDIEEILKAVSASVEKAEKTAGVTVDKAVVSIGGNHISAQVSKGVIAIGRADGEVTGDDIERVIGATQAISIPPNKEIIHIIPQSYTLDEQENIKDPLGMNGIRLEVKAIIIQGFSPHIKNLIKCFQRANIDIENFVLSSLAASQSTLTKRQKELGVALVDIGGGTTSVSVFEEDDLVATFVVPVGGAHITNDIAIGLRTSIDVAEKVKLEFGNARPKDISKKEEINLAEIDSSEEGIVSRYHVAEIIEARLEEIFNLVNEELKSIGKNELLPAGVVLTGGTAKLPGAIDLAKKVLRLPVQTGFPIQLGGLVDKVDEPSFSTVIGLLTWDIENTQAINNKNSGQLTSILESSKKIIAKIKEWLKKFLP
jgi:cell division protein FtsA